VYFGYPAGWYAVGAASIGLALWPKVSHLALWRLG
jgi:hypothetical protein